jgi:hypothetical protein
MSEKTNFQMNKLILEIEKVEGKSASITENQNIIRVLLSSSLHDKLKKLNNCMPPHCFWSCSS